MNAIDFAPDGRVLVRLMNLSPLDPLKGRLREPGFAHRRAAEARGALEGARWTPPKEDVDA